MAKNMPAFQFYPSDFMGGCLTLSDEAVGVYIKLLSALWIQKNRLPFDFDKLARAAMTTPQVLHRVWPELEGKFELDRGSVSHARFEKMLETSEARAIAGSLGGRSKKQIKSKTKANQKQTPRSMKNEDGSKKIEDGWMVPDHLNTPAVRKGLEEFEQMRRRIKKPIRSRANSSRVLKNFDDVEHLLYALDVCIANEYQGLHERYRPERAAGKSTGGASTMEAGRQVMEKLLAEEANNGSD